MTTVLVVDDSRVDRRLVGGLLSKHPQWKIEYAADGDEALARTKDSAPDLIVTDLQMPRMDGLELVRAIRDTYPNVPVVLMTAHGSEALAIETLEQGAASYVPKSQLAEKLLDTVEEILSRAKADRNFERLIDHLNRADFTFYVELENDISLIDPLVDLVQQAITRSRLCDTTGQLRIGVAVREALLNALFHGNLEIPADQMRAIREQWCKERDTSLAEKCRRSSPYRDRSIFVDVRISSREARFVIRDEGHGFDMAAVPAGCRPSDLIPESARGLTLIRSFMDDVSFNEVGNEITMIKRKEDEEAKLNAYMRNGEELNV
jgi:CheY-like chemotaxis protein